MTTHATQHRIAQLKKVEAGHAMDRYVGSVVRDWERYWADRTDHRYGKDFHAFLGERILTDFDLRHHDRARGLT